MLHHKINIIIPTTADDSLGVLRELEYIIEGGHNNPSNEKLERVVTPQDANFYVFYDYAKSYIGWSKDYKNDPKYYDEFIKISGINSITIPSKLFLRLMDFNNTIIYQ